MLHTTDSYRTGESASGIPKSRIEVESIRKRLYDIADSRIRFLWRFHDGAISGIPIASGISYYHHANTQGDKITTGILSFKLKARQQANSSVLVHHSTDLPVGACGTRYRLIRVSAYPAGFSRDFKCDTHIRRSSDVGAASATRRRLPDSPFSKIENASSRLLIRTYVVIQAA